MNFINSKVFIHNIASCVPQKHMWLGLKIVVCEFQLEELLVLAHEGFHSIVAKFVSFIMIFFV